MNDFNALRFALRINSGKIIFNRAMPERLRTLRHCIFTRGVATENCICSAAFCESAARESFLQTFSGLNSLSQSLTALTAPSQREPLAWRESFRLKHKACGWKRSPWGSCRAATEGAANRRSRKKTVKRSSRRTGVNLQFFPVSPSPLGEQPLFRGSSASKSL